MTVTQFLETGRRALRPLSDIINDFEALNHFPSPELNWKSKPSFKRINQDFMVVYNVIEVVQQIFEFVRQQSDNDYVDETAVKYFVKHELVYEKTWIDLIKFMRQERGDYAHARDLQKRVSDKTYFKTHPNKISSFFCVLKSSPWGLAAAAVTFVVVAVTNILFYLRSSFTNKYHPLLLEKLTFENSVVEWRVIKKSRTEFVLDAGEFSELEQYKDVIEASPLDGVVLRGVNAWNDVFKHLKTAEEIQEHRREYPLVVYFQEVSTGNYLTVDDSGGVYFTEKTQERIAFEMIGRI